MKMLQLDKLSFWEKRSYFENIDFTIIGAGIVGMSTALHLRKRYPNAKIIVLEKGYLPSGASTKNAGFACFGSPSELFDDYQKSPNTVWETVLKRYQGLHYLKELIGADTLDFQQNGSWEIFTESQTNFKEIREFLPFLNAKMDELMNEKLVYTEDVESMHHFGFNKVKSSIYNRLEGQIDTGKMMRAFEQKIAANGILYLGGIEVKALQEGNPVILDTNIGEIKSNKVLVCTNGFAQQLLPQKKVLPARAQVLVTEPIPNLKFKGTFHYDEGYYYFRNFEQRILLGGGRNLNFEGETTTELDNTSQIMDALNVLLKEVILPNQTVKIDYQWAGIMGVGENKTPFIEKISPNIAIGVKMGGMGVAIGSLVGKEVAELIVD
jgi:gamma-glutamylputrescine oxidase